MLKFLVRQQKIEILEREIIASDQIAFVTLKFTFDGDWKRFHKVVQFTQCDETYNRVLGTDGLSCLLPVEIHAGAVRMSVFGYDADNTEGLRATTVPVTLNIRQSGFVGDDDNSPIPPTPDLYTQLLQKIKEKGKDGKSAYDIAVGHGFIGSEAEWLESLKGSDGKDGVDGKDGEPGADGRNGVDGVWSEGKPDGVHLLMSTAIDKGLYHPRCKDGHTTYFEGISDEGEPYTESERRELIEQYNAEQKSNYAKNQAEKCTRIAMYSLDAENKKVYAERAEKWREIAEESVDKSGGSGIMELRRKLDRKEANTGALILSIILDTFSSNKFKQQYLHIHNIVFS